MTQLTLPDTRALKPTSSRDLMADALLWIGDNTYGWLRFAMRAIEDGRATGHVSVKRNIEDLRRSPYVSGVGAIKLPNAYSAPFGRILRAWYPELAGCIPMHVSKVDGCAIPPCPEWARL